MKGITITPHTRYRPAVAKEIVSKTLRSIKLAHQQKQSGAMSFDGGPVWNVIAPDQDRQVGIWLEETFTNPDADSVFCQTTHYHPHGERLLQTYTADGTIIVMSYDPITVEAGLDDFDESIRVFEHMITDGSGDNKKANFAVIPPNSFITMTFPPGISHNFMGFGPSCMVAIHPQESQEISETREEPNLEKQTETLDSSPLIDCERIAQYPKTIHWEENLPAEVKDLVDQYWVKPQEFTQQAVKFVPGKRWMPIAVSMALVALASVFNPQSNDTITIATINKLSGEFDYTTFPKNVVSIANGNVSLKDTTASFNYTVYASDGTVLPVKYSGHPRSFNPLTRQHLIVADNWYPLSS